MLTFHYQFTLSSGQVKQFEIHLDPKTLRILNAPPPPYPEWTDLSYHQCPNCPLKKEESPQCPAALHVSGFIPFAAQLESFEEAEIEITVSQRTYRKKTAVQYGLSSLMGIYMAASGCPVLDKFRPLVKTHLPFAKPDEVTYRTVSMYLLAQFFRMKEGKTPDWELKGLTALNRDVETVNEYFWKRISVKDLKLKDGGVNALGRLNTLSKMAAHELQDAELQSLKEFFSAYL